MSLILHRIEMPGLPARSITGDAQACIVASDELQPRATSTRPDEDDNANGGSLAVPDAFKTAEFWHAVRRFGAP